MILLIMPGIYPGLADVVILRDSLGSAATVLLNFFGGAAMKRVLKILIPAVLCLFLLFLGTVFWMGEVLQPVRKDYGALWHQYVTEPKNSVDLLVLGASYAYCGVVPAEIYRESGVTSYVMAGPRVTASLAYYDLCEALKTQQPKVILLEASSFFYKQYEDYTRTNIGYMPWGSNRLAATFRAAEPEERFGLLFPLVNYADRRENYTFSDYFAPRGDAVTDPLAGYTFLDTAQTQTGPVPFRDNPGSDQLKENLGWLDKIVKRCDREGIPLVLFFAPRSCAPGKVQLSQLSGHLGTARLVNFCEDAQPMGLDPETDYYDVNHLNCLGAEKFSRYLAAWLREECSLAPTEGEDEALWEGRVVYWDELLHNGNLKMEN